MTIPTEEEMKGAVDNLLRTVERTPSPSEPNFEFISIDAGDFQALVDLARLASTTPTRSQGEGEAVAEAFRKGAMYALVREPWDDADDFFTLCGMGYAKGEPLPAKPATQPAEGGDGLLEATIELRTIETVADYLEATGLKPFWVRAVRRLQDLYPAAIAKASRPPTEAGGEHGGQ